MGWGGSKGKKEGGGGEHDKTKEDILTLIFFSTHEE